MTETKMDEGERERERETVSFACCYVKWETIVGIVDAVTNKRYFLCTHVHTAFQLKR